MKNAIPLFSLDRQDDIMGDDFVRVFDRVRAHGRYILGPEVTKFEEEFSSFCGVKYAIGVASGTDSLTLAVRALRLGPFDGVIVPANVYPTAFGIAMAGVSLQLCDCGQDGNVTPGSFVRAIRNNTRAIVVVHLYGNPVDVSAIRKTLRSIGRGDIAIIEDCAQAHGAMFEGKHVGQVGDIACFSFYPSKNLGALGDGGMICTSKKTADVSLRRLRMYGEITRYRSVAVSGVSRLDELQAAFLRLKLKRLTGWNNRRRSIAQTYDAGFVGYHGITPLPTKAGSCRHLYVVSVADRARLARRLEARGIGTGIHYPEPVHLTRAFAGLGYKKGDFPVAESLSGAVLSLPLYPELTDGEVDRVISSVKESV